MDVTQFRRHRIAVAQDVGMWLGLFDENGEFLCQLPPPTRLVAPEKKNEPGELEMEIPVNTRVAVHTAVSHLVADGLGRTDSEGALVPITDGARLVVVETPGDGDNTRRVFKVTHVKAEGAADAPGVLTIYGLGLLDFALGGFPCPSDPAGWQSHYRSFERDEAVVFGQPRMLTPVRFATQADGVAVRGAADRVIVEVIDRSLKAAFRVAGTTGDAPVRVRRLQPSPHSPQVTVLPDDNSILSCVGPVAALAGVQIRCDLWLPGDPAVDVVGGGVMRVPTAIVSVRQR